ncbi:histone 2, partial [Triplophysa rosa]
FGARVLCHGLGSLRHGVFGQLTGQQQTDGGLDLSGSDGGALVVVSETRCLTADALKDVVDERVHDAHGLRGDTGVRMNLLQDFIHVDSVTLLPGLSALLYSLPGGLGGGFLRALLGRGLRWLRH